MNPHIEKVGTDEFGNTYYRTPDKYHTAGGAAADPGGLGDIFGLDLSSLSDWFGGDLSGLGDLFNPDGLLAIDPSGVADFLGVERLAKRIDDSADEGVSHRHPQQLAGGRDRVPLVDGRVIAEDHHADRRLLQVERHPLDAALERDHLAGHDAGQAVDARNAVADLKHVPHLGPSDLGGELLDLTLND